MMKCDKCHRDFEPEEGCYIGPVDESEVKCDPFMDFVCICFDCNQDRIENRFRNIPAKEA